MISYLFRIIVDGPSIWSTETKVFSQEVMSYPLLTVRVHGRAVTYKIPARDYLIFNDIESMLKHSKKKEVFTRQIEQ